MKPRSFQEFAQFLVDQGRATWQTIEPCTTDDIEELRITARVARLPEQYESFLKIMGRRAGDFLTGTDFFYPAISGLADDGREFLEENDATHLMVPGSVIVGMHGGYQLYWIEPGQPSGPVRFYVEEEDSVRQSWPTFLDCVVNEALKEIEFINNARRRN